MSARPRLSSLVLATTLAALAAGAAPAARAAESFDACTATITSLPATINTGGRYCLVADLATAISSGNAIDVAANNVTIDCNGFKIGNLAAGSTSLAKGINTFKSNTRVIGCHFRGFRVAFNGFPSDGAVLEDNVIEGALYYGIYADGIDTRIHGNRLVDIGGNATSAYAVWATGRGDIRGNTIAGVTSTSTSVVGIYTVGDFAIIDNTLRGLQGLTGEHKIGIQIIGASSHTFVERNRLQASDDLGHAIYCGGFPIVRENSAIGFNPVWALCPDHGDNAARSSQPET